MIVQWHILRYGKAVAQDASIHDAGPEVDAAAEQQDGTAIAENGLDDLERTQQESSAKVCLIKSCQSTLSNASMFVQ